MKKTLVVVWFALLLMGCVTKISDPGEFKQAGQSVSFHHNQSVEQTFQFLVPKWRQCWDRSLGRVYADLYPDGHATIAVGFAGAMAGTGLFTYIELNKTEGGTLITAYYLTGAWRTHIETMRGWLEGKPVNC